MAASFALAATVGAGLSWQVVVHGQVQGANNPTPPQGVEALFGQVVASSDSSLSLASRTQEARDQLLWRAQEALPMLRQKAHSSNPNTKERLLAQALVGRITQPQRYAAFEQALAYHSKRLDNVPDAPEQAEQGLQGTRRRGRTGAAQAAPTRVPRVILLRTEGITGPLPGVNTREAVPLLMEKAYGVAASGFEKPLAMIALAHLKAPEAFEPIAQAVQANRHHESGHAMEALRILGDKRAVPLWAYIVASPRVTKLSPTPPGRPSYSGYDMGAQEYAAETLGQMGDASVLPVLDEAAAKSRFIFVRRAAAEAAETIRRRLQGLPPKPKPQPNTNGDTFGSF